MMSEETVIPEFQYLLQLVEKKFGNAVRTSSDYEALSYSIEAETRQMLSASTLKRLFGYVSLKPVPRKSTLDILSNYIGELNFNAFCAKLRSHGGNNSLFFSTKAIYSSELAPSARLKIGWNPDRVVVLEHKEDADFEVIESFNSQLKPGDRFEQESFMIDYPLYISRIYRNGTYTPPYVAGVQGGLNLLEVL